MQKSGKMCESTNKVEMHPKNGMGKMTTEKVEIDLEEECCGICRFFRDLFENGFGNCHRRSPNLENSQTRWPGVLTVDWCGEFEKED